MPAIILPCSCVGVAGNARGVEFQEQTYGDSNRVFNQIASVPPEKKYRCTICGREVSKAPKKKDGADAPDEKKSRKGK